MRYELYTTVDITSTGQFRPGNNSEYHREQNFQTVLQTLNIRSNVTYYKLPVPLEVKGSTLGFNSDGIIIVWKFEFEAEREGVFGTAENPIKYLLDDFEGVPFISGLNESMEQNFNIFVTDGPATNIKFNQI